MSSRHSSRHKESAGARVVDPYPKESGNRRPSAVAYDRMPSIREDQRASSKSYPISIPEGKSKSRHDWVGSPTSDSDSLSGSMRSLALVNSNTSSVRRDSYSSCAGAERRPPATSYVDDDKSEIDGIYGAAASRSWCGRRESYGSPTKSRDRYYALSSQDDDRKDIDGMYGFSRRDSHRRSQETSYPSYDTPRGDRRCEKGDYTDDDYAQVLEHGRRSGRPYDGYLEHTSGHRHR